jgi:hypothetical protein
LADLNSKVLTGVDLSATDMETWKNILNKLDSAYAGKCPVLKKI